MKISILIYSLAGGGAERVVSQLLQNLKKQNIDVTLVLMNNTIVYEIPKDTVIHYLENSSPFELGVFKFLKLPLLAFRYQTFLRNENITVSLSFLTRPNYINSLANFYNTKRKVILSERSNPSVQYGGTSFHSLINAFLIKKLFSKSNGIIANSEGNRKELIHNFGINSDKIMMIHNPIDLDNISNYIPIRDFYDTNYFNFISVGRLTKGKNQELLLRAFNELKNKKIRLYIFGDGELGSYLKNEIVQLNLENQVFLKGFSTDIFSYLKGADAFLFGSNHEGFPNVLVEAMACGLPIVSTNCPSGPNEIMEDYNLKKSADNIITKYGILVPVNNKGLMIDAIIELVDNKEYYDLCKEKVKIRAFDFRKDIILKQYDVFISKQSVK
jgi:N-acetylgalactosamine-N,N'-diacetylbacillosaminyl-diphospho-undecaprenol 4-alpha-N-acetylgalactosaminyltransferase